MQAPAWEGRLQPGVPAVVADSGSSSSAAADLGTTEDIQSQKHRPASRSSCGEARRCVCAGCAHAAARPTRRLLRGACQAGARLGRDKDDVVGRRGRAGRRRRVHRMVRRGGRGLRRRRAPRDQRRLSRRGRGRLRPRRCAGRAVPCARRAVRRAAAGGRRWPAHSRLRSSLDWRPLPVVGETRASGDCYRLRSAQALHLCSESLLEPA